MNCWHWLTILAVSKFKTSNGSIVRSAPFNIKQTPRCNKNVWTKILMKMQLFGYVQCSLIQSKSVFWFNNLFVLRLENIKLIVRNAVVNSYILYFFNHGGFVWFFRTRHMLFLCPFHVHLLYNRKNEKEMYYCDKSLINIHNNLNWECFWFFFEYGLFEIIW